MMKLYKLVLLMTLVSGCTFNGSSYFVRFWNGNIPPTLSDTERKYWDECNKEVSHLPDKTWEEDRIATGKFTECLIRKEKELGIYKRE